MCIMCTCEKWQRDLQNYPSLPQGGGVHAPKTFRHPQHGPHFGGVKSFYTYPDRVYAILSYRRLLQKPKLL